MSHDVAKCNKKCKKCQLNRRKIGHLEIMTITPTSKQVFDITSIDTIGSFSKTMTGTVYVLTIQCGFTKFITIIPNKEAATTARAIIEHFILVYETMKEIMSDQGMEFET